MPRIAGPLLDCALALANAPANAQSGATPATPDNKESAPPSTTSEPHSAPAQPPTADDVCRALEQSAAENALPVEFFARVIWEESRFDAKAVSSRAGATIHAGDRQLARSRQPVRQPGFLVRVVPKSAEVA